jgi:hypothetical protein
MYQLDVGSVYVYPDHIELNDAHRLEIPKGFDSILVNSTHYVLKKEQVSHAYTISCHYISNEWLQDCRLCNN